MIRLCALALMFWPVGVFAQTEAAEQARRAMADLEAASAQLDAADGARDRVQALTQTIQAFETGLGAMREGLRQAAINEARSRSCWACCKASAATRRPPCSCILKGPLAQHAPVCCWQS